MRNARARSARAVMFLVAGCALVIACLTVQFPHLWEERWAQDDAYVNVPVRTARDRGLSLSTNAQIAIGAAFLVVLPIAFFAGGITIWWRRRRR